MACRQTGMRPGVVWKDVLLPSLVVTLTAAIIPMALFLLQPPSVARMLEVVFSGFLCTAVCSFFFGATAGERDVLVSKIKSLI